jgi:hypothetical protein
MILKDSVKMDVMGLFGYTWKTRARLLNEIMTQQDDTIKDIGELIDANVDAKPKDSM